MHLGSKDRKKPTAATCLSTSCCRVTINDHMTLSWRSECPSSNVNLAGPLKHTLLNIRCVGKGFLPPFVFGESTTYSSLVLTKLVPTITVAVPCTEQIPVLNAERRPVRQAGYFVEFKAEIYSSPINGNQRISSGRQMFRRGPST